MSSQEPSTEEATAATRVVLSHPADLGAHGRRRIDQEYYRRYLRKTKDRVAEGEEWAEFTDVGCCGCQMDVPLRVERVEGGSRMDPETTIEYTEHEPRDVNPGWSVQYDEPEVCDWR
jgi:hypothetical protein